MSPTLAATAPAEVRTFITIRGVSTSPSDGEPSHGHCACRAVSTTAPCERTWKAKLLPDSDEPDLRQQRQWTTRNSRTTGTFSTTGNLGTTWKQGEMATSAR